MQSFLKNKEKMNKFQIEIITSVCLGKRVKTGDTVVCVFLPLEKSFFSEWRYISVVDSGRRNVLKEGWDSVSQN